jgi:hypothetical protein
MTTLTAASRQLFSRPPDERYPTLDALYRHCREMEELSNDRWVSSKEMYFLGSEGGNLLLRTGEGPDYALNSWSFAQVCKLAGVGIETVNKVRARTAASILEDTFPNSGKPLQLYHTPDTVRSLHGHVYSRLRDTELLDVIREYDRFTPPPVGFNGATGIYGGDRDIFVFEIDAEVSLEIGEDGPLHPGYIVHNSTVGARMLGITTFYFQRVCANHIIHGVHGVAEFTAKHTSKIGEALDEVRRRLELLAGVDSGAHDSFVAAVKSAMKTPLGTSKEEATKALVKQGFAQRTAGLAAEGMKEWTVWGAVDSLTRLSRTFRYTDDRVDADRQAARLLRLAA